MLDDLGAEEFGKALSDLEHGDSAAREQAMTALKRLVNTDVERELQRKPVGRSEQMRQWAEVSSRVERRVLNQPEIARALIGAMDDPSARVRGFAALELGSVQSDEAGRVLVKHLRHDPHHQVRMMCISALTLRKPPAPLAVLVDALGDREWKVVFPACIALGKRGDRQAVEPLRELLSHPSWEVRYRACEALVRLGAVDRRVVEELEALCSLPDAAEHDEMVLSAAEMDRQLGGKGEASWTCGEVLEKARNALGGGTGGPC